MTVNCKGLSVLTEVEEDVAFVVNQNMEKGERNENASVVVPAGDRCIQEKIQMSRTQILCRHRSIPQVLCTRDKGLVDCTKTTCQGLLASLSSRCSSPVPCLTLSVQLPKSLQPLTPNIIQTVYLLLWDSSPKNPALVV